MAAVETDQRRHPLLAWVHTQPGRCVAALVVSVAALFAQSWAAVWLDGRSFFLFLYPALLFAAWFGGLVPGLMATVGLCFGAWYFLLPSPFSFDLSHQRYAAPLIVFFLMGIAFSIVGEHSRRLTQGLKHAHRASRDAELKLRAMVRSRETFVTTLTHDLRTPLRAARVNAELMMRRPFADEGAGQLLGQILDSLQHLDQMIQRLLEANSLEAGQRLPISPERLELRALVRDVLDDLSRLYGDRFRLVAESEIVGCWDGQALRRIIENLAGNAVKYGDAEAPISIRLEDLGNEARMSVHNCGDAIPPDAQVTMFEPFLRLPAAQASGRAGWGIGLAFVRGAAEAHGGSVSVYSAANDGTTFAIDLPKQPVSS